MHNSSRSTETTTFTPVARSPLALAGHPLVIDGWEYSSGETGGPVVVTDRSALAKVQIRATASTRLVEALGTRFGRTTWSDGRLVVGSGPDEWLILGAPGTAGALVAKFTEMLQEHRPTLSTVIDLTHGRALMRVNGPNTLSLLARVTAVDLDNRLVPDGSALRTSVAGVVTDLIRDDHNDSPSYLLHCERSSGRYLQQSLLAAGTDLGAVAGASDPTWPDHPRP